MDLKNTQSNMLQTRASAQISSESLIQYMRMNEETKEFEEQLQESRENNFLDSERLAMNLKYQDIDTSNLLICQSQLEKIDSRNCEIWDNIIRDCYTTGSSKQHPLRRVESIADNANQTLETNIDSVRFNTDKIQVSETEDEYEKLTIEISDNREFSIFVDSESIEMQDKNYYPHKTQSLDTIKDAVSEFDELIINSNSDEAVERINAKKSSSGDREITNTEITLRYGKHVKRYIPEESKSSHKDEETLTEDILDLKYQSPVPSRGTERILLKTLSRPTNSDINLRILDIFESSIDSGEGKTAVPYRKLSKPEYLEQVGRLLQKTLVNVPQMQMLIFTDEKPPEWLRELDAKFPQKDNLDNEEIKRIEDYIGIPEFVQLEYEQRKDAKSHEILLNLYEDGHIQKEDITSYHIVPWPMIKPSEENVKRAIDYGEYLKSEIERVDNKYETDLYENAVNWKKKVLYGGDC